MNTQEIFRLSVRVLADFLPENFKPNAIYAFAHPKSNQAPGLNKAAKLYKKFRVPVAICGHKASGYDGFTSWQRQLVKRGLPKKHILAVPHPKGLINTLSESQALIQFAKQRHWQKLIIASTPYHQIRAFMTLTGIVQKYYPKLKLYSQPGLPGDWNTVAIHHQGIFKAKRRRFLRSEFQRILKYQKKGDLLSAAQVLAYFKKRDG